MDYKSGNTLRKVTNYAPEERCLFVKTENPSIQSVEIFDNVFARNVQYSIKKRKRWMISSILDNNLSDEKENPTDIDQPIMYSMFQFQKHNDAKKATYIMDTMSGKEYGSRDTSHREFNGGSVNYNSVLAELKRSEDKSNKIDKKNKHRNKGRKSKRNERIESCSNESLNDESSIGNIYSTEEKSRDNCVYMNEYIYVNNPLNPNACYRWRAYHKRKKTRTNINDYINDDDYIGDFIDEDYYDDEDDLEEEEAAPDFYSLNKPFVITQNDLSYRYESNGPKKRRKRKLHKTTNCAIEEQDDFLGYKEKYFEFIPDNLPTVVIEQSHDTLINDIKEISKSSRCWMSNTFPRLILIGLDEMECDDCKQFLSLKLLNISENDMINVRVTFNIDKFDFDQIQPMKFDSVQQLILFVQSKLTMKQNTGCVSKMQLLKLNKPIEKLVNTWKVTSIETTKPIVCFHEEWENYELDSTKLHETINTNELSFTKVEKCEICFDHFTNEDLLSMSDCQHKVCESCLSYHLGYQLHFDIHELNCPVNSCKTSLDCATILSCVSIKRYHNRQNWLEKQTMNRRFSKCYNCKILTLVNSNNSSVSDKKLDYRCNCGNIICGFCGEKQHWPTSCNEMKIHNYQIIKLNDKHIKPVTPQIPKSDGRPCPKCGYIIRKYKSMDLHCYCKWDFCFVCGYKHHKKCKQSVFNSAMEMAWEIYNSCPEPDNLRPKFYCQSMSVRLLLRDVNSSRLKQKLIDIDRKIKNYRYLDSDSGILLAQYSQILTFVESIYISMYRLDRKDNTAFRDLMKKSAKNLMFYVYQFESKLDKLNEMFSIKRLKLKNPEIMKMREELNNCLNDAINYVTKLYILID